VPSTNWICLTSKRPAHQLTLQAGSRSALRSVIVLSATFALASGLAGCAHLPPGSTRDSRDHAERFNRAIYRFNTVLDHAILRPVARGYVKVTPGPVRTGLSNFLSNLGYTKTIANDLFQAQFRDFGSDIGRLVVNTSVGIGGVFDPATHFGLTKHDRDFGQTLGKWGLPTGSYLVLPLLGPTDVRDGLGMLPDRIMSIDGYLSDPIVQGTLTAEQRVDGRAKALRMDRTIDTAYDPYALVRNFWFQNRDYKVHGDSGSEVILLGSNED
jgi:phospholipid-binding lipoprotein MlaA